MTIQLKPQSPNLTSKKVGPSRPTTSNTPRPRFTAEQRKKIADRFKREIEQKVKEIIEESASDISDVDMKFRNRTNKVLRKFWDFQTKTVFAVERETDVDKLELAKLIRVIEKYREDCKTESDKENMTRE